MNRFRPTYITGIRAIVAACLLAFASQTLAQRPADPRFALDQPADMRHIKLELDVDIAKKHIDGVATLRLTMLRPVDSLKLDAVNFTIRETRAALGGAAPADAQRAYDDKQLIVYLPPNKRGDEITIVVEYAVDDPELGLRFYQPSDDAPEIPNLVWSQGESLENRYWIPCFDHPNERQTSELIITTDAKYITSSNGKLLSTADVPSNDGPPRKRWHWLQDKPHVSYLITMVVGELALVEEKWRDIPVRYYVPIGREKDASLTFGKTPAMLELFSNLTGIPYPWDQYAQVCCYGFGGGMENTSATTLGATAVQDERSMLDSDIADLISHELAHQWWGDLLTCRDWAHLWLNEGFASYFESIWLEHAAGRDSYILDMLQKLSGATGGGKALPIVDRYYKHADDQFDSRAYPKGAWVLHMLRDRLGDDLFWKTLREYGTTYAMNTVETGDLRRVAERVSGASLERFFHDWTERPGHPLVEVSYRWKPDANAAEFTLKQTAQLADSFKKDGKIDPASPEARPFHFPLKIACFGDGDSPIIAQRDISTADLTFEIPLAAAPKFISVDPDFAVLMDLKETKPRELWIAQLHHDPHIIGRVRAARALGAEDDAVARAALVAALTADKCAGARVEIAKALGAIGGDTAIDALVAGASDPDHKVRRECVSQLGNFPRSAAAETTLRKIVEIGDRSYRVETAAIRAFGRVSPDHAVDTLELALQRPSLNETIRSAALDALADTQSPHALTLIMPYCERGRPLNLRRDAFQALRELLDSGVLQAQDKTRIAETAKSHINATEPRLRAAAIRCLQATGEAAKPYLRDLDRIAKADDAKNVRTAARDAAAAIRKADPLGKQIDDLRKQVDQLKEQVKNASKSAHHPDADETPDEGDDDDG
ncbi:MAG: HEAT repeat domain-containing protein [Phycisphaerales bacterium]|nr:HEAT repeat domain-containing protein [Phycisphaerales bacterium]